jgi:membrane fusion protein (multidrug efflux system)
MKTYLGWIGCSLAVLLLAGCGKKQGSGALAQKPMPLVQVAKAEKRDLSKTLTYTGSVEPVKVARMASPAEGPIVECSVREGDLVKKGQILARVGRSRIAETGLDAAREELRRQAAEFKRVEQLVKSGSLPGEQLDAARSNLKRAEAQVAAMETGAGDYEIGAPWDGVVSRVWIAEGNYVSPRAPLVELYDPASLIVRISIPEQQALAVRVDQPIQVSLDAYPGRRFTGKITRVYPELERTTRTLTAEAVLNEEARLLSGMFARVDVAVQTLTNAVVVPESALAVMPNGEVVAFVVTDETAARRKVKTALEAGGAVAIESGIQAGEMVVTRGNEMLKDGAKVQVAGQKKKEPSLAPASQNKPQKEAKP